MGLRSCGTWVLGVAVALVGCRGWDYVHWVCTDCSRMDMSKKFKSERSGRRKMGILGVKVWCLLLLVVLGFGLRGFEAALGFARSIGTRRTGIRKFEQDGPYDKRKPGALSRPPNQQWVCSVGGFPQCR